MTQATRVCPLPLSLVSLAGKDLSSRLLLLGLLPVVDQQRRETESLGQAAGEWEDASLTPVAVKGSILGEQDDEFTVFCNQSGKLPMEDTHKTIAHRLVYLSSHKTSSNSARITCVRALPVWDYKGGVMANY